MVAIDITFEVCARCSHIFHEVILNENEISLIPHQMIFSASWRCISLVLLFEEGINNRKVEFCTEVNYLVTTIVSFAKSRFTAIQQSQR